MITNWLKTTTIVFLVLFSVFFTEAKADTEEKSSLEIMDIKIEPVREGKNVVHTQVRNTAPQDQVFAIYIQTRSPDKGGWGTTFTDIIKAGQTKWTRHACKIRGSITEDTWIRLQFYNPGPSAGFDRQKWFDTKPWDNWFKKVKYFSNDVEHYSPDETQLKPASKSQAEAVTKVLLQLQDNIKNKNYETAWALFTQDFKEAEFQISGFERFKKYMEMPPGRHYLSGMELLALEPKSVNRQNDAFTLAAEMKGMPWEINFVKAEESLKIDSIQRIDAAQSASKNQAEAVIKAFEKFQDSISKEKYEQAWKLMSKNFQGTMFQGDFENFKVQTSSEKDTGAMATLLGLHPESVTTSGELLTLHAKRGNAPFEIFFIEEEGRWKIDGGGPGSSGNWKQRLLTMMEKRITKHFDIYYFKDSTAEKEIEQIAEEKEKGFEEICRFLGADSDIRICMVFFEDGQTKKETTGHQGAGWATGNTIVEIYNEEQKLDPYHETVHVLMRPLGNPPALFNEGFAVYMSERLGAPALKSLSGGFSSIYERVRELKSKNEWIPLEELITYTDIGPGWSRPPVSYPEAASFVKFLIDKFGKEKFLSAYKTLRNSNDKNIQRKNLKTLEEIYGKSLAELESQWQNAFLKLK